MEKTTAQKGPIEKPRTTPAPAGRRRVLSGVVVSNKMKDTVSVAVTRYVKHPKYKKFMKHTAKYLAHDAGNTKAPGDKVRIEECRPLSRRKHFRVIV